MKSNSHSILVEMQHSFFQLLRACEKEGVDIYELMAAKRFGKDCNLSTEIKDQRKIAKEIIFDFLYLKTQNLPLDLSRYVEVENLLAALYSGCESYEDNNVEAYHKNSLVSEYIGLTKYETAENLIRLYNTDIIAFVHISKDFYK